MKSHSYITRCVARKLQWLLLGVLCQTALLQARAQAPSISLPVTSIGITDAQATNLFSGATVTAGATNVLSVYVSFAPTSLGTFLSLPANVVHSGTNYIIGPTNALQAGSALHNLLFTPVNNIIPVPNTSNVVFQVYAVDANNNTSSTYLLTLSETSTNDAPQVNGSGVANINDQQSTSPFGGITVVDPDNSGQQLQTIRVTLSDTNGYLTVGSSGFVSNNLVYTLANATPAAINTALDGLVYHPINNVFPVAQYFTNTFTIVDSDGIASATNTGVSVVVFSLNDPPAITGAGMAHITDQQTTNPFVNVVVTDPDIQGQQLQTVIVSLSHTNTGSLVVTNSGFIATNSVSTNTSACFFVGTPAQVNSAIKQLVYQPFSHLLPVGQYDTNTFTIVDSDGFVSVTNASASAIVYFTNTPPALTGLLTNHIPVYTGKSVSPSPFATVTLGDPDHSDDPNNPNGQTLVWTVTLTGSTTPVGNLQIGGNQGTSFAFTNDQYTAGNTLRTFNYLPPSQNISGTNFLTIAVTANDLHGGFISNNIYLDLSTLVLPVIISGTQSGQQVFDNSTLPPFANVFIQSRNGFPVNLAIKLTNAVNDVQGQLINAASLNFSTTTTSTNTIYQLSDTSENVTAAIRALIFQPVPNRINGSATDTAVFEVDLNDGLSTNIPDRSTTVVIIPVNDAPQIAGTTPLTTIPDNQTATPFSAVRITDVDEKGQQTNSCTITFNNATGYLTNGTSIPNMQFAFVGGSYTLTGTPTNLTTAMRQLVFVPTPGLVPVGLTTNTTFSIVLDDFHGGLAANNSTVVRVASTAGVPIVTLPSPLPYSILKATNVLPFANLVTISGASQPFMVSLIVSNTAQGDFTASTVTNGGFTSLGGGSYFISGSASNITAAIQQLVFAPNTSLASGTVIDFIIGVTNSLTPAGSTTVNYPIALRTSRISHIVTQFTDDGTTTAAGTLRNAVANAQSGDHITFDLGAGASPQVIALKAPIYLASDLVFDGPGAERLAISGDSNGTGTPAVQLFVVNANVTMNRLTFMKGYSSTNGGAFEVNATGSLKLSYCAVTDCRADQYGGGVDVNDGLLDAEHCLFRGNSTSPQLGVGGGAVSLYTDQTCTFLDTTFATNRQNTVGDGVYSGLGGGAIYAEPDYSDFRFPPFLNAYVLNCTFHDNIDVAGRGTSIRPNDDNTDVILQNTIVADGQGNNLELDLSGHVTSLGGNISDDATHQTYSTGGTPANNYIFSPPLDHTNIPAASIFSALANNSGPTPTYALLPASIAVNAAVSNVPAAPFNANTMGTDQRGYFRTNAPDIGAFELNASQRIIIEEIGFNPVNANNQFIEFYVPRDSAPLNVGGLHVLVDGVTRHTFTNELVQPGQALILLLPGSSISVPSGVLSQTATNGLAMTQDGSVVTVLNANNQVVFQADYVGAFASTDSTDAGHLATPNQSLVLWPQFQGAFLPYERVVALAGGSDTNGLSDPGFDANSTSLGGGNAPPTANPDFTITDAHTVIPGIPVLTNDVDPDITDTIQVVGVGTNSSPGVISASCFSSLGALVTIVSNGASISYNPTFSRTLQSLPQGVITNDTFLYTIRDFSNNIPHSRGSTSIEISNNLVKATAVVSVVVAGVNSAPTPQNDNVTNNPNLTTSENKALDFTTATNILWNDTDPNSDDNSNSLNIVAINSTNGYVPNLVSITTALGARVTLDIRFDRTQTHLTYDPSGSAMLRALNQGQSTNDTFYYTVVDSHGALGTASISILVKGVDNAPTASAFTIATDEDTPLILPASNILTNCADVDIGAVLNITSVSSNSTYGASVRIVGTNIVYDPTVSASLNGLAQKESAIDTFTYTVTDDFGSNATAVVTVLVSGVNDHPVSQPDYYTTDQNTPLSIAVGSGVLANDHDPDVHDLIRVVPFTINSSTNCYTDANGGAPVTMNANGSFTFDPRVVFDWLKQGDTNYDSFTYTVMDHSLSIANNDSFAVNAGTSNNVLPVLANDAVLSGVGGAFTITGVSVPTQGGTVSINASNTIIYTPAAGFVGTETFNYTNSDGLGGGDWATVTVVVTGNVLYALNDAFTVAKGTTNVLNVLANDTIIPASAASITITGLGAPDMGGTVALNGTGPNNAINYSSNPTNSGSYVEHFSYTITSGTITATAQVTVTVRDLSNSLSVNNDSFTVLAGSANNPLDVLANDAVLSSWDTNLVITGFTVSNLQGTVSINNASNRLVFTPSASQSGSITYYITDGSGATAHASALIQIASSGLFANDDYFTIIKNSVSNSLPVMVNDVELPNNGQHLFISDVGLGANAPQNGTVTINPAGTGLIYTPNANFNGSDAFTYEITDGSPTRAQATVHLRIMDTSAAPSNPDTYRVARESVNNLLPVLANDPTLPVAPGSLQIVGLQTNGVHATVAINGSTTNNSLSYTPNTGFIGRDFFSYIFTDNLGNLGTNLISVTVGDLAPRDDAFNVVSSSTNNFLDVRANDYPFPDTKALRPIFSVSTPNHGGTVTTNIGATALLYTPAPGFVGVEQFNYQLADDTTNLFSANVTVTVRRAGSDRDTNTVTIAVAGLNDVPTITGVQGGFHITDKQTVMPFTNVVIGDRDECGYQTNTVTVSLDAAVKGVLYNLGGFVSVMPGVYRMTDTPPNITASLQNLVFRPTENRIIVPNSEYTTFTITANDGYVATPVTDSTTTVLVDSVNDAPVIVGTTNTYHINDKQNVRPFTTAVISDVDNLGLQLLTVQVSLDQAVKGVLQNLGGFTNAGNGVYVMQDIGSNITASLQSLVFRPTENRITVPTSEPTTFTINVNDGFNGSPSVPVLDSSTVVIVTATNDPSTITGTQGGWAIDDKQTVMPLTNVVIADVDDLGLQPLTVTVALDLAAKGVLQNLGGFTNSAPGIYTMRGVGTNITSSIQNLVFKPTENRIIVPNSEVTTLTISVDDGFQYPLVTDSATTITVASTNDAPTITGTATNNITDKQTVVPFATVTIGDVDNLAALPPSPQILAVKIVMDNLDKGNLQNLGGFTIVSNGVFQMVDISTNVTASLRGMVYAPVNNHIIVPTTAAIHFVLSANDGFVSSPTTNLAVVNVTAVNDPPVITGTVSGQLVYDRLSLNPFAGVLITEVDNDRQQALRCTMTLDNANKGVLTSLGGFTNAGSGVYTFGVSNGTVTAAMITTALRGMVYSPTTAGRVTPGSPEISQFTIRVDDFFAPTVVDSNTTVIAIDPLTGSVAANDALNGAQFGFSVATLRDLAVVGAPYDTSSNAGSVYLYSRSLDGSNTWTQFKKLSAPDARSSDHFGTSVAISGDMLVVGSPLNTAGAANSGAAYVYARNQNGTNQWGFLKKLTAPDAIANDQFGTAVAISNTLVAVGSPLNDVGASPDAGSVYLFDQNQSVANQWGLVKKVTLTNAVTADHFGSAVAISGDNLLVGAPLVDSLGTNDAGAAFIFGRNQGGANQWGQLVKILLTNPVVADHFGTAVAINGDNLVVGAPLVDQTTNLDTGAAFLYARNPNGTNEWDLVKKLFLTNAITADHFGSSVAIDGNALVVGVPQADATNGIDCGGAYLYMQNQSGSNAWGLVDKFLPSSVNGSNYFGCAVAVYQNTVVAGAYNGFVASQRDGTAYMFRIFYDNPPQLLISMPNQTLQLGVPFAFAVPSGAFADPDMNDVLSYGLAASPLVPPWLNFDPVAGNFSGTPTAVGNFPVNLVATDVYGSSTTNQFLITVTGATPPNFNLLSGQVSTVGASRILALQFTGMPNTAYRLQQATNLANPVWTDVSTQASDINGMIYINLTNPPGTSFYRTVYP